MIIQKNLFFLFFYFFSTSLFFSQEVLPSWEKGVMELHHINTGRGDAAFYIFPDGTTMLVDAGDMSITHKRTLSNRNEKLRPNSTKTAPEWIVDYIKQFIPKTRTPQLDYALITHYHDDHFGELDTLRKTAPGGYKLTGITEVGTLIPIKKLIDRGSSYPLDLKDAKVQAKAQFVNDKFKMIPTLKEYWKFIEFQNKKNGLAHETLKAGELNQIKLINTPSDFPEFKVQNIAVNGDIWTGEKNNVFHLFKMGDYPGENPLSTCFKISYGEFDYFTGGDIYGVDGFGTSDINSIESNIAPVIGPVDVATLNHHGNRNSQNSFYVRTIRPRVWVQQNWTADQPGDDVLRRILSKKLYPGDRAIFSTTMLQANKDVIGGNLNSYKSQNGHIVVRVEKGGASYEIYILNDKNKNREVIAKFGPYESR